VGDKFYEAALTGEPLRDELVIDAHTHLGVFSYYHIPDGDTDSVVREMDRLGIDRACAFAFAGVNSDFVYGNDVTADAVRAYPDRFIGFAVVNPHYPEEIVQELERCRSLGFRGIKLIAAYQGYPEEGPNFFPAYRFAHENGMMVLSHGWGKPEFLDGLAREYPNVTFIIGHWALDYAEVVKRRPNVYQCTCAALSFGDVERLVEAMPVEKIVYGSDFTDLPMPFSFGPILYARIPEEAKRAILGRNMEAVLRAREF
jgi:predicted TIM-barrel fold metal-dependent hydrolase